MVCSIELLNKLAKAFPNMTIAEFIEQYKKEAPQIKADNMARFEELTK